MPELSQILALVIGISLYIYAMTGGADFGGGVWDLLARGPRAQRQRSLAARAIAPVWEVNHVWMILVLVLIFVCFPRAFSTLSIALHIPLTIMLIGIVLRGTAFTFQHYGIQSDDAAQGWRKTFAVSSMLTPVVLGMCVGAVVSGRIRLVDGQFQGDFFSSWLAPFPIAVGGFFLAICAFMAAIYLAVEAASQPDLADDFRQRAIGAGVMVGLMAAICLVLSGTGAPQIRAGLTTSSWALPLQIGTGAAALGVFWALWQRRFRLARGLAGLQVAGIFSGWGLAQFPYLVVPDLTIANTAAPDSVLRPVLITLICGLLVLIPALGWLFSIFKSQPAPGDG